MNFPDTRWSQVTAARGDDPTARAALAWLCERYWGPLTSHARRRGWSPHSAEDLVQDLFAEVIRRGDLTRVASERGRFRSWLCACLDHLASHERDRRMAIKRGGAAGRSTDEPLVSDPDPAFDRDWGLAVLGHALDRLEADESAAGRGERFAILKPLLAGGDGPAFLAAGGRLGLGEGAVKVAVHRLRDRLRELTRSEIAATLADPSPQAVADEWAAVQAALAGNLVTGGVNPVCSG